MKNKLTALLGISSLLSLSAMVLLWLQVDDTEVVMVTSKSVTDSETATIDKPLVCLDLLEQDENATLAAEYGKLAVADCMFVGCGGTF